MWKEPYYVYGVIGGIAFGLMLWICGFLLLLLLDCIGCLS